MNAGTGFLRFQTAIAAITEAIGEPTLQPAVAKHAIGCLEMEVRHARGLPGYGGLSWGSWWTTCTTAEFDAGTDRLEATLTFRPTSLSRPAIAEGPWLGTVLRIRDSRLQAEGGGYRIFAGSYFEGHKRYDHRLRRDTTQWQISMDKEFLECAGGRRYGGSVKETTHASTEANAQKALIRMAKDFLGVEMVRL